MAQPDMKMSANPSMDFTSLLEGEDRDKVKEILAEKAQPGEEKSSDCKMQKQMSRISTEASVGTEEEANPCFQYEAVNLDVPVVIVASEIHPWSKSGGLAIVAAQYAYNFAVRGHRTMAIAPMYDDYEGAFYQCTKSFEIFGAHHEVRYFHHYQSYGDGARAATTSLWTIHPSAGRGVSTTTCRTTRRVLRQPVQVRPVLAGRPRGSRGH
ncbi:unnamed protein product [Effrenium voratum]|nr:unnamed protein product [Effrenium voratum]